MIELTTGRSVKWQHNGAWFTGSVLNDEHGPAEHMTHLSDGAYYIVRHSNTSAVFIVKASELQDNDFRKEEKRMEVQNG